MSIEKRICPTSIVTVAEDQISCELEREAAILNLTSGMYYGLDAIGATVWSLIGQPRTVRQVRDELLELYEAEPERCERDLIALLQELASKGLIQVKDAVDR
jgi:hypothetical protein